VWNDGLQVCHAPFSAPGNVGGISSRIEIVVRFLTNEMSEIIVTGDIFAKMIQRASVPHNVDAFV
jgi:hypothetical protein